MHNPKSSVSRWQVLGTTNKTFLAVKKDGQNRATGKLKRFIAAYTANLDEIRRKIPY